MKVCKRSKSIWNNFSKKKKKDIKLEARSLNAILFCVKYSALTIFKIIWDRARSIFWMQSWMQGQAWPNTYKKSTQIIYDILMMNKVVEKNCKSVAFQFMKRRENCHWQTARFGRLADLMTFSSFLYQPWMSAILFKFESLSYFFRSHWSLSF